MDKNNSCFFFTLWPTWAQCLCVFICTLQYSLSDLPPLRPPRFEPGMGGSSGTRPLDHLTYKNTVKRSWGICDYRMSSLPVIIYHNRVKEELQCTPCSCIICSRLTYFMYIKLRLSDYFFSVTCQLRKNVITVLKYQFCPCFFPLMKVNVKVNIQYVKTMVEVSGSFVRF